MGEEMENNLPAINYSDRKTIEMLKRTVAVGATDEEFAMFSELCKSTGLNPFKREIWFIKAGGRAQIMTGINGYLSIANRHQMFDGMEVSFEWEGDRLVAAECKVHRKDRKYPSVAVALMSEWAGNSPIWKSKPSVMLAKVAKSIAIREAFSLELAGTYTEEEMPPQYSAGAVPMQQAIPMQDVKQVFPAELLKPKGLRRYTIEGIAEEKLEDAFIYLQSQGAYESETPGIWYSEKRIPKMDKYEITETQLAEGVAA
jgi:phage recombination protein Bet